MRATTQSTNLKRMQLENLIFTHVPTAVLDKHDDAIDKLDALDVEVANMTYKLEQLRAKRLRAQYALLAQCLDDMPFDEARNIFKAAIVIDPQFMNSAEAIRFLKHRAKELQALTKKGLTNEITPL